MNTGVFTFRGSVEYGELGSRGSVILGMTVLFGRYQLYVARCGRYVNGGNYGGYSGTGLVGIGLVLVELWIYEVGIPWC